MVDDNQSTNAIPKDDTVVVMAEEPKNKSKAGRPQIDNYDLWSWLDDMKPFLRVGMSLSSAIEKAGLNKHRTSIYEYYRKNKDFSDKIDRLQATISELNDQVIFNTIERVHTRQLLMKDVTAPTLTTEEVNIIRLVAEKHRTSQTHWVNRVEEAKAKDEDFGRVIERPIIQIIAPEKQLDDKEASQQVTKVDNPAPDPIPSNPEAVPSA